jgi:hypothetical protein
MKEEELRKGTNRNSFMVGGVLAQIRIENFPYMSL